MLLYIRMHTHTHIWPHSERMNAAKERMVSEGRWRLAVKRGEAGESLSHVWWFVVFEAVSTFCMWVRQYSKPIHWFIHIYSACSITAKHTQKKTYWLKLYAICTRHKTIQHIQITHSANPSYMLNSLNDYAVRVARVELFECIYIMQRMLLLYVWMNGVRWHVIWLYTIAVDMCKANTSQLLEREQMWIAYRYAINRDSFILLYSPHSLCIAAKSYLA